ncbi:hypothetical protein V474_07910 [Novosphingobium barchaimii LL02]|uniref:Uncharacterized protein n=1 Tax=Novosphingobium barchaimii LL02 TaxID=1114963 RepID=A0A0J7Y8U4_9SPHN|nr:hypothetical protein [Novosphingobium barchaimii]KMS60002.1 hypothetical protein V474_07910 [Novosphingobium barchaimii LL02]
MNHSEAMGNVAPPLISEAAEEARKERITWIALGAFGLLTGCIVFVALCHALGPVPA